MITYFSTVPENISYMALPNGYADVWLRKNISESTDSEGEVIISAEEVYFRTALTYDEVISQFDELFENGDSSSVCDVNIATNSTSNDSSESNELIERISILEEATIELAELVAQLLGGE